MSAGTYFLPALAAATAIAGLITYWYWDDAIGMTPKPNKSHKTIPRIGGHVPVLGDALTMSSRLDDIHELWKDTFEKNDNATTILKLPLTPLWFMTNNPQIVEYVLKTNFEAFEKGPIFHGNMKDFLGNGIFNVDGDLWKSQRKNAAAMFNVKNFKDFVNDVFSTEEHKLAAVLVKRSATREAVDLSEMFFHLTFDSFMQIAFGFQTDSLASTDDAKIMKAFDSIQARLARRLIAPFWQVTEFVSGESVRHKQEKRTRGGEDKDLLSMLMYVKDDEGRQPSDTQLVDYVLNFLLAGRDTTAVSLSWTFYMLHKHPVVLASLRKEISAVLNNATPTYDQIKNSLPYAIAIVRETLRLYPAVPGNMKQAITDATLPDGTFIPKGSFVNWNPYAMGRTEAIWGFDAKQFRPERWLEMEKQPSPFDYPVFHAGPRVCLGKQMAELEIVYVMVELVRKFDFTLVNEDSVKFAYSLTLPMKAGLHVLCERRQ
ncbi:cytochrome P450 [Chytriomyces sp. MP71]|nr:cytochrome P450 [Chytriomyces sp. MP71]